MHKKQIEADTEKQRNQNRSQMQLDKELNKLKNKTDLSDEEYTARDTKLLNDPKNRFNKTNTPPNRYWGETES